MSKTRIGKPFVRGGRVVAYSYKNGKKAGRRLIEINQLTPNDLKKGAKRTIVLTTMAHVLKSVLENRSVLSPPK